jgi:hypothetical protein
VEGESEQALFVVEATHVGTDVEERGRQQRPVFDDADAAGLLDDEDPVHVAARRGDE